VHDVVRDAVLLDVSIDLRLVVGVVAQGIEDLGEGQMGEMRRNLLRGHTETPKLHDRSNGSPRANDDRLPAEDGVVPHDVSVLRPQSHRVSPFKSLDDRLGLQPPA
jgi:hypothetical protein